MKNQKIAVAVNNPSRAAKLFGECAGDYKGSELAWWTGSPGELYPATTPAGCRVISAPVRFSGGSAWIEHGHKARAPRASGLKSIIMSCVAALGSSASKNDRKQRLAYSAMFRPTLP